MTGHIMSSSAPIDPKCIFVRNVNYQTRGEELANAFQKFGPVDRCHLLTEKFRGETVSCGAGFVAFKTEEACKAVLDCKDPIVVDGRPLRVFPARQRVQQKRDTLYLNNVPEGVTADAIKAIFAQYNPVEVRLVKRTDRPSFAFVQLDTEEHQVQAVKDHPKVQIGGAESDVRTAYPRRRRPARFFRRRRNATRRAPRQQPPANA